ncbi:MAG: peptide chain release factor N(5)-glutamine methyltransferase [Acidobacteriota bacterium]|nr:peptide chain release factor N(5)-glutamine methyltransferase [Acidobacteriota bacterium]
MTVRTALLQGRQLLEKANVDEPRLTAEVLLMRATGHHRAWLYAHGNDELIEVWWIHYGRYLHQRIKGEPTQYITGRQEFYGREFRVTPDVLIPRPETEHLVEAALACGARSVLDIGTGSGAVAVTLALESKARVTATDLSLGALRVARQNAEALTAGVDFVACDLGDAFRDGSFDLVVSNPPYIAERDGASLQAEVRNHEPRMALFGGEDGLGIYRRLIPEARRLLRAGGWLMMELGEVEAVRAMVAGWGDVAVVNDLAGIARVLLARKP